MSTTCLCDWCGRVMGDNEGFAVGCQEKMVVNVKMGAVEFMVEFRVSKTGDSEICDECWQALWPEALVRGFSQQVARAVPDSRAGKRQRLSRG